MGKPYDYYYENYLMLYSLYGRGRPTVNRERYEDLDRELIDLLTHAGEGLTADQTARVADVEYLLLDDVAEALLSKDYEERIAASEEPGAAQARKAATSNTSDAFPPTLLSSGASQRDHVPPTQTKVQSSDLAEEAFDGESDRQGRA